MMRRIALLTAAFMALGAGTAMAADITYTGASGAWTTAANWDPAQVPAAGDVAIIPAGKQVTLDTPASVAGSSSPARSRARATSRSARARGRAAR